jgi:Tol biopolymer transport system component
MKRITLSLCLSMLLFFSSATMAQYFGKNKVQYTNFNWHYVQSEHFDVYFTDGGDKIAAFVLETAEDSYRHLQKSFRYNLTDRIKIILHNSHNDFEQTNVDLSEPEESVGGFTEFFKNRIVIPYDGEWENFRHVVHHELTHAVMLQMLYGSGVQSIVTGVTQNAVPLWFIEGLAEYESRGWDVESDMFMRDATVNGYVPEIPYLYAFLAYKGGQSVWNYLVERYGQEKVGEILGKVKVNKNFERGLKQATGLEVNDLTKRWHRYLKRKYWPDVENRSEPEEIAKRLTDHRKDGSFVNTSPAISNRGDKLVFKSDKSDFFDIYMMSAIDGRILKRLVKGQRAGNLEELQWLKGPGMSWSPDDKRIVFTARSGEKDAIYIVNVKKGKIEKNYRLDLDGIYNPSWSPKGDEIAFTGLKDGQSDIYVFKFETKALRKLTDDIFSDVEPSWAPDGSKLLFSSDRGERDAASLPAGFKPQNLEMKNYDIYEISAAGDGIQRVVAGEFSERVPVYAPDGKTIAFSSERQGISNIWLKNLQSNEEWPITNVLTGAFQPTWGGGIDRMVFVSFYYAGYDLYLLKNPLEIKPGAVIVPETKFVEQKRKGIKETFEDEPLAEEDTTSVVKEAENRQYRDFIFDDKFAQGELVSQAAKPKVFLDSTDYIMPTGSYKVNKYKVKLTPDLVYGAVGYSQFYGTQGMTNIMLSDVLGNHRLNIGLGLFGDFRNADYAVTYFYLPKQLDIGAGLYHNAYYYYSDYTGWVRDRNYGLSALLSNPFNKFERLSYGLTAMGISRSYLEIPDDVVDYAIDQGYLSARDRFFVMNNLTYTRDTSVWGYTGPTNGTGMALGVTFSPGLGKNGIDFTTVHLDYRRYMRLMRDYTFAARFAGGFSEGRNKQKFFLGGLPNWLNQEFFGGLRVQHIEDIYFASFEMPLRGAEYYALEGNRFALVNLEFRFPLVRRLLMGFPLPIELGNIGGALFTDMGLAWDKGENVKPFVRGPNGLPMARDIFSSIGFGVRMNLGFFLLRWDLAWPTNFYSTAKSPMALWSLGADF